MLRYLQFKETVHLSEQKTSEHISVQIGGYCFWNWRFVMHVELIKLKIAVETLLTDALVSKQLYYNDRLPKTRLKCSYKLSIYSFP